MTSLRQVWATLRPRPKILEPVQFSSDLWSLIERMYVNFNDREAHTPLPIPIARFRENARKAIFEHAQQPHYPPVTILYLAFVPARLKRDDHTGASLIYC
jgi:hypothetical protein